MVYCSVTVVSKLKVKHAYNYALYKAHFGVALTIREHHMRTNSNIEKMEAI